MSVADGLEDELDLEESLLNETVADSHEPDSLELESFDTAEQKEKIAADNTDALEANIQGMNHTV